VVSASGNGCGSITSSTATVTVVADPAITVQPTGFTECVGGTQSLSVTATGGTPSLTYQWQSSSENVTFGNIAGATSASYAPPSTSAGTMYYRVVVSAGGNGCGSVTSTSATVTVVADPAITMQPTGFTECVGGTLSLSVIASGGTPSLTYQWQSSPDNVTFGNIAGATFASYTPSSVAAGTTYYRVVVSASGNDCGSVTSTSATVTVVADPAITVQPAGGTICSGGTHSMSVTATGGTPSLTYQWQSSPDNVNFSNITGATSSSYTTPALTSTTYFRVRVSSGGVGCGIVISNSAPVVVYYLTANAGEDFTLCSGTTDTIEASVLGNNSPYTFSWSHSLGSGQSKTVSPIVNTTYSVTVTSAFGCTSTDEITVSVIPSPEAQAGTDVQICAGMSTTLTGTASGSTPPYLFTWNEGLGNGAVKSIEPITTTTYILTVSAANGCSSQDQVTVTVNPLPEITTSSGTTICSGSSTTISASGAGGASPYNFSWNQGLGSGTEFLVSPTANTTYIVTVTGADGCSSSASIQVNVNATPSVDAGLNETICNGHTATLTAIASGGVEPYTFAWNQGLGAGDSKVVSPSSTKTYIVSVTGSNGCQQLDSVTITVLNCQEDCFNDLDDDGDGLVDCADPNCGPSVTLGPDKAICIFSSTTLTAIINGGAPYNVIWSNGLGSGLSKTVNPTSTTTYSILVTSLSGCTDADSITVNVVYCDENCTNGLDDDGDGLTDCADPDCLARYQPLTEDDYFDICPGLPFSESVSINDGNLANAVYSIVTYPTKGFLTIDQNGKITYTPSGMSCSRDSFVYQICNSVIGCCNTAKVYLTIGDNIPPVLTNIPTDITISCSEAVPLPTQVFGFDACPGIYMQVTETSNKNNSGSCGAYTITRTWTATDLCGNAGSGSQLIHVVDSYAPELFKVHTLANGKKLVAGVAHSTSNNWNNISFPITMASVPLVFVQVGSTSESSAVTPRIRNVTIRGFEVRLMEQENSDILHQGESLHWFAVEQGTVSGSDNLDAGIISGVSHNWTSVSLAPVFSAEPGKIFSVQTNIESDPVSVRCRNATNTSVEVKLQEEKSRDTETSHAPEDVAYLALTANSNLKDKDGEYIGESGFLNLTNAWTAIKLKRKYTKPVVVLGGFSFTDSLPAVLRVRNVASDSFEVHIENWDYLPGSHGTERLTYVVIEGSVSPSSINYCQNGGDSLEYGVNLFYRDNCDLNPATGFTINKNILNAKEVTSRNWNATDACGNNIQVVRMDTCNMVALRLRAILGGAYMNNGGTNMMRDDLRKASLIPVTEPYSSIPGFKVLNNGYRDSMNPALLMQSDNNAVVDWVLIELRNGTNDRDIVATNPALVQRDGDIILPNGDSIIYFENLGEEDYYVALRHRNHLGIITDGAWFLSGENPPLIDFTNTTVPVRGGSMNFRNLDNKRLMWGGDFNLDTKVVYQGPNNDVFSLFSSVLASSQNTGFLANYIETGYHQNDFNLDGKVIYQGPNNDRAMLLYFTVLAHPENMGILANFIVSHKLP
jgi:hypothetical protein